MAYFGTSEQISINLHFRLYLRVSVSILTSALKSDTNSGGEAIKN